MPHIPQDRPVAYRLPPQDEVTAMLAAGRRCVYCPDEYPPGPGEFTTVAVGRRGEQMITAHPSCARENSVLVADLAAAVLPVSTALDAATMEALLAHPRAPASVRVGALGIAGRLAEVRLGDPPLGYEVLMARVVVAVDVPLFE